MSSSTLTFHFQNNHSCENIFETPARSVWNQVFTGSGRELVGSELPACSSIQERINELTVILTEAGLIADVVEFACVVK